MKPIFPLLVLFFFLSSAPLTLQSAPTPRNELWQQVKEAQNKQRPKTAIEALDKIITSARDQQQFPEAVKALVKKITFEGQIQGNRAEEQIQRLEKVIKQWPKEAHPILETVLAQWYWSYFQQNRWRFLQRTRTGASPGNDIQTWDLPRILAEIDQHFTTALKAASALQKIPIADWADLLEKGNLPDSYRPTLYDFIAFEALRFYSSGEQAGSQAQDAFVLSSDSAAFDSQEQFLAWKLPNSDEDSLTLKALNLYQRVLSFHQNDTKPDATIDANLGRLEFAFSKAFGENKNDRYQAALKRFIAKNQKHQISTRAQADLATLLRSENQLMEARKVALAGAAAFPGSLGSNRCANIVSQIEHPSLEISAERVWNQAGPEVSVNYRNLKKVHFRIYRYSWDELRGKNFWNPDTLNDRKQIDQLLTKKAQREWSVDLPITADYKKRREAITVPDDLDAGFYFLLSSHKKDFRDKKQNQVRISGFWVSRLALIMRTSYSSDQIAGFVLDALSGEPVKGAKITAWTEKGRKKPFWTGSVKTDANGLFHFKGKKNTSYLLLAEHQGQAVSTMRQMASGSPTKDRPHEQTYFFTDRALYRPGQTIRYKGLSVYFDQKKNDYHTIKRREITVIFQDVNGKEITKQTHTSNAFGSFSGSFTAPRDRLMGRMNILSTSPGGSTSITVEEYKRPKFKVDLASPAKPAKLGEKVVVSGKATAYTGAAIDGAKVRYRIMRQVHYPSWWGWCFWWRQPQGGSQEIAHGTTTSKQNGSFDIPFTAKPAPGVSEEDEATFRFTVYADVTDKAGETRSDQRSVKLGFTTLKASLFAEQWQETGKAVEISVNTSSLDEAPRAAKGLIKIYSLEQPDKVQRTRLASNTYHWRQATPPQPDPANPNSWENGKLFAQVPFATDKKGKGTISLKLKEGIYRAILESTDAFGKKIQAQYPIRVFDTQAKKLAIKIPFQVASPKWSLQPGDTFTGLWGSGYDQAQALVEIFHRGKAIQRYWTTAGESQSLIQQKIGEEHRGGLNLFVTMIKDNRAYTQRRKITVPWSNKNLTIKWQRHRSKLEPGSQEKWSVIISGSDAQRKAGELREMVATLYDESLDAYLPHRWMQRLNVFYQDEYHLNVQFQNRLNAMNHIRGNWSLALLDGTLRYRHFPDEITRMPRAPQLLTKRRMSMKSMGGFGDHSDAVAISGLAAAPMAEESAADPFADDGGGGGGFAADVAPAASINLDQVSARTNLSETAFFLPHLTSLEDGSVKLDFTMPEALTSWKFFAFAHDQELRSGFLSDSVITAKDLMLQPNPPRFLREGDTLEFSVKLSNQSDQIMKGKVRLSLSDARTLDPADQALGNQNPQLDFEIPAKQSRSYSWKLQVPDGQGFLIYKAVASTGKLSDGEEGYLPVLPRRILVTESLPLPIRGKGEKTFEFEKLLKSADSDTLQHQSLTVQMVSNPSWYAIMALPYLMEYPHQCSEQIFNRYYANALAQHLVTSDPKIEKVFKQWQGTDALDSPLEKNQDLKQVMLEETPWLRQSSNESEARKNVGILFDKNRTRTELKRALQQLAQQQENNGLWPWFPGGRGNEFISLYISTGFGRLRHLGVKDIDVTPAIKSLKALDSWIDKSYRQILADGHPDENHLSPTICYYLYGRSFFLNDQKIAAQHQKALTYFHGQAKKYWPKLSNRQNQAHLAIALQRFDVFPQTSKDIMISLKERAIHDEKLGMFWRDTELNYWWYRAPIETQAMMIEAFDEVAKDKAAVEDLKVWLLKQKQTQDWKTTKATADAIYALLLRGTDLLASDELVEVSLAGKTITPQKVEAGTGFYEQRFGKGEILAQQGKVKISKKDDGVAWGSLHWQYLESIEKITPHEGTPLTLKKTLWRKENSDKGPVLKPVRADTTLQVGDELVVRLELRSDRDMEYLHLKDQRGSGTEPINVLSRYKYQDGLGYYQSTRDTASHFFIDYLPKGSYVFEYSLRIFHKGSYQSGMANIQCMYAPEFNSHSQSFQLKVE
ncbi:MAG: MG2 domain-containing protein [Verrucomicrobiales bacterium]|nr:MG2 domain-containing protein [Verrucomicrobiales bacterium]